MGKLNITDFEDDAKLLNCEVASIIAVARVESSGSGFYTDGMPTILFEPHIFHRKTKGVYANDYPYLSYQSWKPNNYGNTADVKRRFKEAFSLDKEAACYSTSFGMFQIMGFHYNALDFKTAVDLFEFSKKGENEQLWMFTMFVKSNPQLLKALQNKNWQTFARLYNGSGYKANRYDEKMQNEYLKVKRELL